jgi:hypothetical protein
MPRNTTIYDLLISCPGDIQAELEIIEEVLNGFNSALGATDNIMVNSKHWSKDSYPEAGGNPQELLNKQFIKDCDILVAILWTRFGTMTDTYGSGTEQEIEEAIDAGKQVFVYFSDKPKKPSEIDNTQMKRVNEFREKYKNLTGRYGIYGSFDSDESFRREFTNHLHNYFLQKINNTGENTFSKKPKLTIKGLSDGSLLDEIIIIKNKILDYDLFSDMESNIVNLVDKINSLVNVKVSHDMRNIESKATSIFIGHHMDISFTEEEIELITSHCKEKQLKMSEAFFYLGNLCKKRPPLGDIFNQYHLDGTEDEKEKYECIIKLIRNLSMYSEFRLYLEDMKKFGFIQCAICNLGTTFDEDIAVKLKIPIGCYAPYEEMPIPGMTIIRDFLEDDVIDLLFGIDESENIEVYDDGSIIKSDFSLPHLTTHPFQVQRTEREIYEMNVKDYNKALKDLFVYKYIRSQEYDLICFKVAYLKQNTNMAFPALIPFSEFPEKLEYEIRSKHFPSVVKGELRVLKSGISSGGEIASP